MNRALILIVATALVAGPFAGCLSFLKDDEAVAPVSVEQAKADELLGDKGREKLLDAASTTPKNFTFPGQQLLEKAALIVNDSVASEVTLSYEGNQDQGGTEYNTVRKTVDISKYVPVGQPTEIFIKLLWDAKEFNSVDYDIFVDVPGTLTDHSPAKSEDMNWNIPTKVLTVNTVGVAGANHLIGVQASSGKTFDAVPYTLIMTFAYAKDVVTPGVPYAFQVPANASGLIFESEKAGGDDHVRGEFIVIGPNDELVSFIRYNDIAIPTESVFVPVNEPGEYIFWAFNLTGGFLSVRADAPLDNLQARTLKVTEESVTLDSAASPGMVERDWTFESAAGSGTGATPMQNQKEASFSLDGAHPLDVKAWIRGSGTLATQVRLTSASGLAHDLSRILKYEDERGSIGYSSEEGINNIVNHENIVKGAYKVEYVNNGATEVGYSVKTYQR